MEGVERSMRVLGVVASHRRLGNSEILVKEALRGAEAEGAETHLLRLSDFDLDFCDGCMACVFKRTGCHLQDDVSWLLERLLDAGGLVIGAPTYFLAPAATIKTLTDRVMAVLDRLVRLPPRPAATIAVAGLPEWDQLAQPLLNKLALVLGCRITGSMVAHAPGPGQILLREETVTRARELGRSVVTGEILPRPRNCCPICYSSFFIPAGGREVYCPLCRTRGRLLEAGGEVEVVFEPEALTHNRWSREAMEHHFLGWIVPTREMFLKDLPRIREARQPYLAMDDRWLRKPATTGTGEP